MEISIKSADSEFLNIPEVANLLRVSKLSVRNFIEGGLLPRVKLGGRVLIYRDDLLKFIEERREVLIPVRKVKGSNPLVNGVKKKGRPRNEG